MGGLSIDSNIYLYIDLSGFVGPMGQANYSLVMTLSIFAAKNQDQGEEGARTKPYSRQNRGSRGGLARFIYSTRKL